MAEETFDLVFRGELVPGADPAQVKLNLARLFKMDPARVEKLFSGKAIVLKRGVTMDTAAKYRIALKKAGARLDTVAGSSVPRKPEPQPAADAKPGQRAVPQPGTADAASSAPQSSGLSLAPMEGYLLGADEKQQQVVAEVDTSSLSLRPDGQSLVDENELARSAPVPVAVTHLDVAPAGADVLKPEERRNLPEVEIDLSHLSASEPGDRLEAPRPAAPPAPDVSGLSLEEI